jgi:hypothetical protein
MCLLVFSCDESYIKVSSAAFILAEFGALRPIATARHYEGC